MIQKNSNQGTLPSYPSRQEEAFFPWLKTQEKKGSLRSPALFHYILLLVKLRNDAFCHLRCENRDKYPRTDIYLHPWGILPLANKLLHFSIVFLFTAVSRFHAFFQAFYLLCSKNEPLATSLGFGSGRWTSFRHCFTHVAHSHY